MAEAKTKKTARKSFFEIKVPLTSVKAHVYGNSVADIEGKIIKIDLTRSLKGKCFELRLKVKNVNGNLEGEPISLWLVGSFIRRAMRTGIDYVEDSFETELKDGKARVKPFLITRNKVSRAVRRELRNNAKKYITEYFKTRSAREIFSDLMTNKIQKEMFLKLKKIYPLTFCEIRVFEIINA
ncbi:MAG: 40S ribosomal protein S3a/S1 [Candidatus Pacearchaeota archaeon]|nr:40S ribosomal protein S3a/S1 [Candidatus Pacearchaeota archaeon]